MMKHLGSVTMTKHLIRATARLTVLFLGVATLAFPAGPVWADHVRIDITGGSPQPPAGVGVAPSVAPPMLQAEEIRAHQVRATTIYANKIVADEIQGVVHQTSGVKIDDAHGEIKAPEVSASVIYADEITANSVVAADIYVRKIHRR